MALAAWTPSTLITLGGGRFNRQSPQTRHSKWMCKLDTQIGCFFRVSMDKASRLDTPLAEEIPQTSDFQKKTKKFWHQSTWRKPNQKRRIAGQGGRFFNVWEGVILGAEYGNEIWRAMKQKL